MYNAYFLTTHYPTYGITQVRIDSNSHEKSPTVGILKSHKFCLCFFYFKRLNIFLYYSRILYKLLNKLSFIVESSCKRQNSLMVEKPVKVMFININFINSIHIYKTLSSWKLYLIYVAYYKRKEIYFRNESPKEMHKRGVGAYIVKSQFKCYNVIIITFL